ncbi:MAG: outer membrane protein assembly factor BamC [Methylococcales bacterium]
MKFQKTYLVFLIPLLTVACSGGSNTRYKDTRYLETPPVMVIKETPKMPVKQEEELEKKGLGEVVSISSSVKYPILKIKKNFDRSWDIVEQALNLAEIEITDKDRDKGVYYLKFDPDTKASKDSGVMDSLSFFLFKDEYAEAAYKLTVQWQDTETEVKAELIEQESDDLLDDGEDNFEDPVDSGAILIKRLYKTIRDDLPLD